MALLNVRLDPQDARRAKALREAGVQISTLVRNAIRAEYDKRVGVGAGTRKPSRVVAEILSAVPDPSVPLERRIDPRDRLEVRRLVSSKLRRKRR